MNRREAMLRYRDGTMQATVPAPLAGVRLARPVMNSGEGARFGRAAVAANRGPSSIVPASQQLLARSSRLVVVPALLVELSGLDGASGSGR